MWFQFLIISSALIIFINSEENRNGSVFTRRRNKYQSTTTETENFLSRPPTTTTTTTSNPINFTPTTKGKIEFQIPRFCGERTTENLPWLAIIEHTNPNDKNSRKTVSKGVLISERHVLTTVSSIHNTLPFWIVSGVRLGDSFIWVNSSLKPSVSKSQTIGIEQVYQHENKDLAVIKMSESVNFTESIQPICLPLGENYNFRELFVHTCKKIFENNGEKKTQTEFIPAYILSPQDCIIMFDKKGAKISNNEFCAWDQPGDTCAGDIGGPLIAKYYGKYFVTGLNSFVITNEEINTSDYPGVYVNVGSHLNWIRKVITSVE